MTEIQMQMFMPDIPRLFTALAEWLACIMCIRELKPRITGWKRWGDGSK